MFAFGPLMASISSPSSGLAPLCSLRVHGRHAQDLGPLLPPQLGAHHAADSRPDGVPRLVDQHTGIVVKLDHAAIGPLRAVSRPYDDSMPDVSSLDLVGC